MFRYRVLIILTIAWIAFVLNLERPDDLFFLNNVNISSFVYVLSVVVMVVFLLFLRLVKLPLWMLIIPLLALYIAGKVVTYEPDVEPAYFTYLSIIEITGLVITVWMVRMLAEAIEQFNVAIEKMMIQKEKTQVLDTVTGESLIRRKIDLARRFERDLAIIYVKTDAQANAPRRLWDQEEKVRHMYMQAQIAELMNYVLESNDIRLWQQGNLLICMPEASPEKAEQAASQIRQLLRDVLGLEAKIGIGCFPEDGLIYQDLISAAVRNLKA